MPIYMRFFEKENVPTTVRGDVTAKGHEGWIELSSAQLPKSMSQSGGTGPTSSNNGKDPKAPVEIVISKLHDAASQALMRAATTGQGTGKFAVLDFTKTINGQEVVYLKIVLQGVMISSYSLSSASDRASESISLNGTKITFNVAANSPDLTHADYESSYDLDAAGP